MTASGLLFSLHDDRVTHGVKAGPTFEFVARNELGERTYAFPALSGGQLFLRSFAHLYCITRPAK